MAISDKITSIENHLTNDWTNIEALGVDIDCDKNIENIADKLDELWESQSHIEDTGTTLSLNTNKGKAKVDLLGNTYQETTSISGGDEFDSPSPDHPQPIQVVSGDNSVLIRNSNIFDGILEVGSINSSGTKIDSTTNVRTKNFIPVKENTDYIISTTATGFSRMFIWFYDENYNKIGNSTKALGYYFTTETNTKYVLFRPDYSSNDTTMRFWLNEGQTALTYQPYQSTTYPINLPVENLLENNLTTSTISNVIFNVNDDKSISLSNTASANISIDIGRNIGNTIKAGSYIVSGCPSGGSSTTYAVDIYKTVSGTISKITTIYGNSTDVNTFTLDETSEVFYRIIIKSGVNCNGLIFKPQIEEGSKANSYTPYGTTPLELCKIGDYKDYFYKNIVGATDYSSDRELGAWYLEKNIGKLVFDGDETFVNVGLAFQYSVALNNATNISISNMFTYSTLWASSDAQYRGKFNIANNRIRFMLLDANIDTLDEFYSWCSSNNIIAYYPLATPTYTKIEGTLASQLEDVWRANTYDNQTNVSQVNNDLPFELYFKALGTPSNTLLGLSRQLNQIEEEPIEEESGDLDGENQKNI